MANIGRLLGTIVAYRRLGHTDLMLECYVSMLRQE
jgi:hypothetical protein